MIDIMYIFTVDRFCLSMIVMEEDAYGQNISSR